MLSTVEDGVPQTSTFEEVRALHECQSAHEIEPVTSAVAPLIGHESVDTIARSAIFALDEARGR